MANKVLIFAPQALEDLSFWIANDKKKALKILDLIKDVQSTPFTGLGKPEPLKHQLSNYGSRRIDIEHRLIYSVSHTQIVIIQCRYHY